jgi:hypothetical protein
VAIVDGVEVPVNPARLAEIIEQHVATKTAVERDGKLEVVFPPYRPDDKTLRTMLTAGSLENGNLAARLPRLPPSPLSRHQLEQAQGRLRQGEPVDSVAHNMNVDIELIKKLRA